MVAVPAIIPLTAPEVLTVATAVGKDAHVPPDGVPERVTDEPAETEEAPEIAALVGAAFTVTIRVVVLEPHSPETV